MRNGKLRLRPRCLAVALLGLALSGTAAAQHAAVSGGVHWSGGGGRGGYVGAAPGYGYGGRYGYAYGGYGWRYGGYGWRYGYPGWGCCWGGWGWGWPVGVYLSVLPWYYSTVWWQGVPYYYADSNYYLWNGSVYEQVQPPTAVSQQQAQDAGPSEVFAYPKNGQSDAQQASDKSECRAWAAGQTGFNPATPAANAAKRPDYLRAQVACLEGRGYSAR